MMFEAILDSTLALFSTVANSGIDILIRVTLLMIAGIMSTPDTISTACSLPQPFLCWCCWRFQPGWLSFLGWDS